MVLFAVLNRGPNHCISNNIIIKLNLYSAETSVKVGFNKKAVFWLGFMALTQISRSRFKQSKISPFIPDIFVLGCFVNFGGIFGHIWG